MKKTGKYIICITCGKKVYCSGSRFKYGRNPRHCSLSCAKIGHIPWNKNKKGLQTAWNKNKKNPSALGNEYRRGLIPWNKGIKTGLVSKGAFPRGIIPWNKNKTNVYSEEQLQRMSESQKRRFSTPEAKQINSQRMKNLWQTASFRKKALESQRQKPNNLEMLFNEITPDIIRYVGDRKWWHLLPSGKYKNPDFKVTGQNKVIEVFGDYWHRNDDPQELIDLYKQVGFDCLVIWEHELYEQPDRVLEETINFL